MKYAGMPWGMWVLYKGSFKRHLISDLDLSCPEAKRVTKAAGPRYREIIRKLPDFERADRFKMNIVNCALLIGFLVSMHEKPSVEKLTDFYANAMMNPPTRWFCRMSGKKKFTEQDIQELKDTAQFRAADRNPYSWNMEFLPYPDGSGYEARFTKCGICTLMKEYGLYDLVPAMCRLDYTMSDAGRTCEFIREYTLAGGGPYCDCGYKKRSEHDKKRADKKCL